MIKTESKFCTFAIHKYLAVMKTALSILFLFCSILIFSQQNIILIKNTHTGKYKKLESGKIIKIENLSKVKIVGQFSHFNDTAIFLQNGYGFHKDSIKSIILYRWFLFNLSYKLFVASAVFPLISMGNNLLNDNRPIITEYDLMVPGIFLSLGSVARLFYRRKYKIHKGKWKLSFLKIENF